MRTALAALLLAGIGLGSVLVSQRRNDAAIESLRREQSELGRRIAELSEAQRAARTRRETAERIAVAPPPAADDPVRARPSESAPVLPRASRPSREAPRDDPEAVPLDTLIERFDDRFGRGRIEALEDLEDAAEAGHPRALDAIVRALADDDPRVREEALGMVESLGDPALMRAIAPLIDDPNADVREQLADTLEEMPMSEAGPLLRRLLDDSEPDVVAEAIESIGTRAWQPARPDLERLLDDNNLDVAAEAAAALRQLGEGAAADSVVPRIAMGLRAADPQQRREALLRVRRVGGPEARRFYEQALDDPEADIRNIARKELEALR